MKYAGAWQSGIKFRHLVLTQYHSYQYEDKNTTMIATAIKIITLIASFQAAKLTKMVNFEVNFEVGFY